MTAQAFNFDISEQLRSDLRTWRSRATGLGALGLLATVAGWVIAPAQFYRSYLWAYVFFVGISAGCLAWLGGHGAVCAHPSPAMVAVAGFPTMGGPG